MPKDEDVLQLVSVSIIFPLFSLLSSFSPSKCVKLSVSKTVTQQVFFFSFQIELFQPVVNLNITM